MSSIYDIANKTGYSIATVSRYMNNSGYVSKRAANKIAQVIKEENYSPNMAARTLVTKKSTSIAVIVDGFNAPTIGSMLTGIEKVATKRGYNVNYLNSNEDEEQEKIAIREILSSQVAGVLAVPTTTKSRVYKDIINNFPFVTAIRELDNPQIPTVVANDYKASYRMTELIIRSGHTNIGFLRGLMRVSSAIERWRAVEDCMKHYNVDLERCPIADGNYDEKTSYITAMDMLVSPDRPTILYGANHVSGMGMLRAAKDMHLNIPEDISMAAFDGLEGSFAENAMDFVTANIYPTEKVLASAMEILVDKIEDRENKDLTSGNKIVIDIPIKYRNTIKTIHK